MRCRSERMDTAEFTPSGLSEPPRGPQWDWTGGRRQGFIWLAAGRITPAKDYPNLLRAFARVRTLPLRCAAVDCRRAARARSRAVKQLSARLTLGDSVRWLGLCRDMPALLDAADGFVSASAWEGMPLAVGEAMAMEKPVVATDVGGVSELAGDAGVVIPAKNPKRWQRQCWQRCSGAGKSANKQAAGAGTDYDEFSVDPAADAWEALYRELLA